MWRCGSVALMVDHDAGAMSEVTSHAEVVESALFDQLPLDGRGISNERLLKRVRAQFPATSEEVYDRARSRLIARGVARPGPGRGGALRRADTPQPPMPDEKGQGGGSAFAGASDAPDPLRHVIGHGTSAHRTSPGGSASQLAMFGGPPEAIESPSFLTEQVLTYIGNKRSLLDFLGQGVDQVRSALGKDKLDVFDAFAGSGVVSRYLKRYSRKLVACDLERYSFVFNSCYLANRGDIDQDAIRRSVERVERLANESPRPGFVAELYATDEDDNIQLGERVFYTRRNAVKIDSIRALIDEVVPPKLRTFVLAPLLYKASVHANTSGVFKGFYKNTKTGVGQFGGNGRDALTRICRPIELPVPVFSRFDSEVEVICGDTNRVVLNMPEVDLAYLDPPYNQHPYGSNYFMLNLIEANRRPSAVSDVSGIPTDWNRSDYNKRPRAKAALGQLVRNMKAKFLLISFNSEGFISKQDMMDMLTQVGKTQVLERRYNTFRGSRNLNGRDIHVKEYLFLVEKDK